jgi:hypothetical protein
LWTDESVLSERTLTNLDSSLRQISGFFKNSILRAGVSNKLSRAGVSYSVDDILTNIYCNSELDVKSIEPGKATQTFDDYISSLDQCREKVRAYTDLFLQHNDLRKLTNNN